MISLSGRFRLFHAMPKAATSLAALFTVLTMLGAPVVQAQDFSVEQAEAAYSTSNYGYCDAKKIASVWGVEGWKGKAIIGGKLLGGRPDLADAAIANASKDVWCTWQETELTYDDASRLAGVWGLTTSAAKDKAKVWVSDLGTKRFREIMNL